MNEGKPAIPPAEQAMKNAAWHLKTVSEQLTRIANALDALTADKKKSASRDPF